MTQEEKRRADMMKSVLKACDRIACELKGTSLTEEEFKQLADRLIIMAKMLYMQRSERSKAATHAFNEAMQILQQIRK